MKLFRILPGTARDLLSKSGRCATNASAVSPTPGVLAGHECYFINSVKFSAMIVGGGFHASACFFVDIPLNTNAVGHPTA